MCFPKGKYVQFWDYYRFYFRKTHWPFFLCNAVGHTSNNCKKNSEKNSTTEPIINTNAINDTNNTDETQPALTEDVAYSSPSN